MQKRYEKVAQWYGGKDGYLAAAQHPVSREVAQAYQKRLDAVLDKLNGKRECPLDSFAVKELVGEYGFVMKQFLQIKEEAEMMLAVAHSFRDEGVQARLEERYGAGAAAFFAGAIETFYNGQK